MKFLVDVNASGMLATWLTKKGHDVVLVSARNPRMTDEEILHWAVGEQRIIITTDNDFEEMVWRERKPHCGIVRLENLPRAERIVLLEDVLERHSQDLMVGVIIIAQRTKFRIRKFQ